MPATRRLLLFGAAAALVVLLIGSCAGILALDVGTFPPCAYRSIDPRLKDARSMVRDGRLIGLSVEDLPEVLGPTAKKQYYGYDYTYYLGPDSICIDSWWLVLRADDGRVTEAAVMTD